MGQPPSIDISARHLELVRDILQAHVPGREVWAFGSRAKKTAKQYSDLDIVMLGEERLDIHLAAELREAFQESALPFKVDIVDWAATDEGFRKIIQEGAVVLQARGLP